MKILSQSGPWPLFKFDLKMRLTLFFLLVSFLGLQAKTSSAQKKITLNYNKIAVSDLLDIIEVKSDFNFVYRIKDVDGEREINVKADHENIEDLLKEIFIDTDVNYRIFGDQVFLGKNANFLKGLNEKYAKTIQDDPIKITGTVTNSQGVPLPGVNITVKGSSKGTTTDFDGNYEIEVERGDILEFSFVGFNDQEITVGEDNTIDVTMEEGSSLDEVLLVGYGTATEKEITSAVSSIKPEEFNQGGVNNPMDLIEGKVAGLSISQTGANNPINGPNIQLRGITSIEGSTSPLIVIDGIPGGSLDMVQQDDIKSISVLKDGSAAAIYGTRANGGVIIIETKGGKKGAPLFEYSTYFKHQTVEKRPNNLNASQFRELIKNGTVSKSQDFGSDTDLFDALIDKNNLAQYHYLSASGGGKQTTYRASVYFRDKDGIAKENDRKEHGGRININQTGFNDRLKIQFNLSGKITKMNRLGGSNGDFEQAVQWNPTAPIYDEDGYGGFYQFEGYNAYNPLSRLKYRIDKRNQENLSGSLRLELNIYKGLSVSAFGSYEKATWNDRYWRSSLDWDQRPESEYQGMGYASKSNHDDWHKTFESTIDYDTIINENHSIKALLGYSYQYGTTEEYNVNNNGFTSDAYKDWDLGAGSAINNDKLPKPGMGSNKFDNTLVSFFGRISYSYKDKYFAQALLRREGSSRFGKNHKWGNFPAASIGWSISDEDFMKSISFVNQLKLRVGYGVTGNQGIPNYQSLQTLGTGGVYPINGQFFETYGPSTNPNPDLKWEKKKEWNIGLDFGIYNNKISGSLDVFDRSTSDLLYNYRAQLPAFVQSTIFTNVGDISNRGIELELTYHVINSKDFSWDIDFTGSYLTNKMTSLSNSLYKATELRFGSLPSPGNLGDAIRVEEGGELGNFYGKRFAGFNDDGKFLFYKKDGSKATSDKMDPDDSEIIGNGVPNYNASISTRFAYKNFDLTLFFRGKFHYDILNVKDLFYGNPSWLPNNVLESAITKNKDINDDPQYSDYYLESGDFVKLDNLTLGYNFNFADSSSYLRKLRLYFTARNLFTITGYSGLDPEVEDVGFNTGMDNRGFYPPTRSFTIGLKIGF